GEDCDGCSVHGRIVADLSLSPGALPGPSLIGYNSAVHRATIAILALVTIALVGSETGSAAAFQAAAVPAAVDGKLIVFGDVALFLGKPGAPGNCALQSRFKHGDPVGFRATAIDPVTGEREPSAQFVVHLTYAGQTQDLPMRYRATPTQPERQ